jgi:hypothetical protein
MLFPALPASSLQKEIPTLLGTFGRSKEVLMRYTFTLSLRVSSSIEVEASNYDEAQQRLFAAVQASVPMDKVELIEGGEAQGFARFTGKPLLDPAATRQEVHPVYAATAYDAEWHLTSSQSGDRTKE